MFIQLKNASKVYGQGESAVKALDGAELSAEQGEVIVVLGPSGSGKSTMLNIIGGLDTLDSGSLTVGVRSETEGADRVPPRGRGVHLPVL